MAAGRLSRPGTEFGPCETKCKHHDCRASWEMANKTCKYCTEVIGFERDFFQENGGTDHDGTHKLVHADELCARAGCTHEVEGVEGDGEES